MRRKLFFFLEGLHITKRERLAMSVLMILIVAIQPLKLIIEPKPVYDPQEYDKLRHAFEERAALMKEHQAMTLARFQADTTEPIKQEKASVKADSTNKLSINSATLDELVSLPGIGKAYAERILEYRRTNGPFKTVEELVKVKGIGVNRLQKLKPYIKL